MDASRALAGVRLKIARADRHLEELDAVIDDYFDSSGMHLEGRYDSAASDWVVTLRIPRDVPAEVATVVGDAAHNLRSALDQLVWALARLEVDEPERTQFPIFKASDEFARFGTRMLSGVAADASAFIERLQPYHVSDVYTDPLFILSRLSNIDKHRHVHLAQTSLSGASFASRTSRAAPSAASR